MHRITVGLGSTTKWLFDSGFNIKTKQTISKGSRVFQSYQMSKYIIEKALSSKEVWVTPLEKNKVKQRHSELYSIVGNNLCGKRIWKRIDMCWFVCVHAQSCLTLCDTMDCSLPGSSVHGVSQARIPVWVAVSSSRGSARPRDWNCVSRVSCIGRWVLFYCATWEALIRWLVK